VIAYRIRGCMAVSLQDIGSSYVAYAG